MYIYMQIIRISSQLYIHSARKLTIFIEIEYIFIESICNDNTFERKRRGNIEHAFVWYLKIKRYFANESST